MLLLLIKFFVRDSASAGALYVFSRDSSVEFFVLEYDMNMAIVLRLHDTFYYCSIFITVQDFCVRFHSMVVTSLGQFECYTFTRTVALYELLSV